MSTKADPNWTVTSTNPASDDPRTVSDDQGNEYETNSSGGGVYDVRDSDGNSVGTYDSGD